MLFKSEERKEFATVVTLMHQLADRLAENQVTLRQGSEEVVIDVPNYFVLESNVEEEDKKGKIKRMLEVEIEWIEGDESGGVVTLA